MAAHGGSAGCRGRPRPRRGGPARPAAAETGRAGPATGAMAAVPRGRTRETGSADVRASGARGAFAPNTLSWTMAHRGQDPLSVQRE